MRSGNVMVGLVSLLLFGGAGRLAYIEYAQGEALRARAERQQTAKLIIPAQRGEIVDTRGRVLAGAARRPSIYMDPSQIDDARFAAYSVAPLLEGVDAAELHETILQRRGEGFVWVKRHVSPSELEAFQELRAARKLDAFVVRYEPQREYPFGETAAHVLGFVGGSDDPNQPPRAGRAGIEQQFDRALRGEDGERLVTVDVRRRPLRSRQDEYRPPRDGATVFLTLDVHIQQRAEHHLRAAVEEFDAEWGTALVMDPHSGEVLAMATTPAFDPAQPIPLGVTAESPDFPRYRDRLRNRAVADSFEPGSMFKTVIFSSALDHGFVQIGEQIAVDGPARVLSGRTIHDSGVTLGTVPAERIIYKSSNIGMAIIGMRCGNANLHEWSRAFGFGAQTGIQLPGEHPGLVLPLSTWTRYSMQSVSFGQEVAVTPLQMLTAFSVLCNGGLLYRPRIVRGVVAADGQVLADFTQPEPRRRVLDPDTVAVFRREALVPVVSPEGTGRHAILPDYQAFGKTATAQIALPGGRGYENGAYMSSFVCGAPADNPQAAVLVSVCRPMGRSYYGGTVAAPAAAAILADTLAYLHVPPRHAQD